MDNFLPYGRQIMEHWIYEDSQYFHVWSDMLFRARYSREPKTDIYKGILYTLNYGEFIFGRIGWSKRLNIGEQKLRTFIQKLIDENMIVKVKALSKLTIYKIVNYEKFNQQSNQQNGLRTSGFDTNSNQQNNQQITSR